MEIYLLLLAVFIAAGLVIIVTVSAQSNGGRLVCQDKWKKGEKVKLVFFISEARFPSQCVSSNHQPYFARSPDGASNTYKVKCTLTNVTAPGACNGSFISNTLGCGCRGKNGSFVVEYNFIAQKEHAGWWKPGLQCLDSGGVQQLNFTSTNCENKIVESTNGGHDKDHFGHEFLSYIKRNWIIAATAQSVLVLLAMGAVIVYCRKSTRHRATTASPNDPTAVTDMSKEQAASSDENPDLEEPWEPSISSDNDEVNV